MDRMDIAKRLQEEARKDRIKLVLGACVMALVVPVAVFAVVGIAGSGAKAMAVIAGIIIAAFVCAALLVLRLIAKMEKDSFGEGMHLVMESVPMVSALLDEKVKPVYCNEEAPKLYGFESRQEYYDKFFSLIPEFQPDGSRSKDGIIRHVNTAFKKGREVFDWWQRMAGGETIPIRVTLVRAFFQDSDHLLEFTKDMRGEHEIKRKERVLKERMQAILDSSPLVCAVFDERCNIVEINKEAENLFAIPDKQACLDRFEDFMPLTQPDGSISSQKSNEILRKAFETGACRQEWVYQSLDGTQIPTEEISQRITIEGQNLVLCYIRDLREFYANKEKEARMQQNIKTMMEQLSGNVTEQAAAVTESSTAIEEMIANIRSVTNTLSKNRVNVKDLQEASGAGHTSLNGIAADIQEIARESESLLGINSLMQNIATQTNLLSMNAAIEAAHAGERGTGFAVVANEVRKLAESSAVQSKTISTVLKKIKGSIDKIRKSTETVLNRFDAIEDGVKTVAAQENSILKAMEEQGQGSKQILQAIGQLNEITNRVKEDARKMVESGDVALQIGQAGV